MTRRACLSFLCAFAIGLMAIGGGVVAQSRFYRAVTVTEGLVHPWGLAFLPDGRMLVTERAGRMRIVLPNGKISRPMRGLPKIAVVGQGGLLDVALHPKFEKTGFV